MSEDLKIPCVSLHHGDLVTRFDSIEELVVLHDGQIVLVPETLRQLYDKLLGLVGDSKVWIEWKTPMCWDVSDRNPWEEDEPVWYDATCCLSLGKVWQVCYLTGRSEEG